MNIGPCQLPVDHGHDEVMDQSRATRPSGAGKTDAGQMQDEGPPHPRFRQGCAGHNRLHGDGMDRVRPQTADQAVQAHGEKMKTSAPTFRQSILQDADRNRRLEVNETLKYTLTLAKELGVATPTLDYCCRILGVVSRAAG
mgnify:CR=1 FL=1